jgi:3-methyl-2-oxobutanoate hydroxymethyltransferase
VVADMPFGSYEEGPEQALGTAMRFMKETHAHAVKLEGGVRSAEQISRIVEAGIPVMAHVGFTPQSEHGLGGHMIQGRGSEADRVVADALACQEAGVPFLAVLGIANEVGPQAHAQWRAHRAEAEAAARRAVGVLAEATAVSHSPYATGPKMRA